MKRIVMPAIAGFLGVQLSVAALPAGADPVADFYKDKTITVVCAGSAGAAHGVYAQLIIPHIKKYIPGDPTVIIQYMPGAGGNKAMNYLYNATRDDGTFIGVPLQDLIFNARIGIKGVKYDAAKTWYLGGADITRVTVTVMKASGIQTIEEAMKREVLMGASGKSAQPYMIPIVLNALMKTKFRVVTGYRGLNGIHLAMERGEVHGRATSWQSITSSKKAWIEKKMINNLLVFDMEREPEIPDVPAVSEMLKSDADKELVELVAGSAILGRAWIAFGGIPAERLAALRTAYAKTIADPAFTKDAAKRGLGVRPVTWQQQQALAERTLKVPDSTVARLKGILGL